MGSIVFLWIVVLTVLAVSCVADRFPNLGKHLTNLFLLPLCDILLTSFLLFI